MKLYISENELGSCGEDYNYNTPSAKFEQMLQNKLNTKLREMERIMEKEPGSLDDKFSYTFPFELEDSTNYNITPDYNYDKYNN